MPALRRRKSRAAGRGVFCGHLQEELGISGTVYAIPNFRPAGDAPRFADIWESRSLSPKLKTRIAEIRADNSSGAVTLAQKAAEILLGVPKDSLTEAARALVQAQPLMAPIFNLANRVLLAAEAGRPVKTACDQFTDLLESTGRRISAIAARLIPGGATVMTHSFSATVLNALLAARTAGSNFGVICTESRPVREGVKLARKLAEHSIPVTLIIDAAVYSHLDRVDLILVGADAVTSNGLVNKTGTSLLASIAKIRKKPVYALCGSEKFVPAQYRLPEEPPKPAAEILDETIRNITVWNYYFDVTPLSLLAGIVSEDGVLTPTQLRKRLAAMKVHPALL